MGKKKDGTILHLRWANCYLLFLSPNLKSPAASESPVSDVHLFREHCSFEFDCIADI